MYEHLERHLSDRGFAHYPEVPDGYGDNPVKVYESSAADYPSLWLNVGGTAAHLIVNDAVKVAHQLLDAALNHYQGDDGSFRPTPAAKAAADEGDWDPIIDEYFAHRGTSS